MTAGTGQRPRGAGRLQLHEVALRLFATHGVEGTSLQAIADEMGVSKAAVYYHYKSKDDLILGVLAPLTDEVSAMIQRIRARRTRNARLDELVTSIVDLAVRDHERFAVVLGDPAFHNVMKNHLIRQGWDDLRELAADIEADKSTSVALSMFVSGLLGPLRDPGLAALGPDTLRATMIDCGRRLLQIRRRPAP